MLSVTSTEAVSSVTKSLTDASKIAAGTSKSQAAASKLVVGKKFKKIKSREAVSSVTKRSKFLAAASKFAAGATAAASEAGCSMAPDSGSAIMSAAAAI